MRLIDELYTFCNTKPRILDLTNGRLPAVHMVTKPIIASHQLPCNTSIIPCAKKVIWPRETTIIYGVSFIPVLALPVDKSNEG